MTHSFHTPSASIDTAINTLKRMQDKAHELSNRSTLQPYELEQLQQLNTQIHKILTFIEGELCQHHTTY